MPCAAGVPIPKLRTEGSRIPRPPPSALRALRGARAPLRKRGAKRRAVPGRGPNATEDHGCQLDGTGGPAREPLDGLPGAGQRPKRGGNLFASPARSERDSQQDARFETVKVSP